jgi:recombination protein RecR
MNFPSKLVENAVEAFAKLPGIGKKTALRLVLFILKSDKSIAEELSVAITRLRKEIKYCSICHNISDNEICSICSSAGRDQGIICVVQDSRDVLAIENIGQYRGLFHVLGGVISPLDGIGPEDLEIDSLFKRLESGDTHELVFALNSTIEADTTAFFISKKLGDRKIKISALARGIPVGGELEYADELTLARSFVLRTAYKPG